MHAMKRNPYLFGQSEEFFVDEDGKKVPTIKRFAKAETNNVRKAFEKGRTHSLKRANAIRKAEHIDELICRLADTLWEKQPRFKGNERGTANRIREDLNRELLKFGDQIPKAWRPVNDSDLAEVERQICRVAKRLREMLPTRR
jgi:hypothetical protein